MDSLTDTVSLAFLRELVDWAEADPLLTRLADVTQARTKNSPDTHTCARAASFSAALKGCCREVVAKL